MSELQTPDGGLQDLIGVSPPVSSLLTAFHSQWPFPSQICLAQGLWWPFCLESYPPPHCSPRLPMAAIFPSFSLQLSPPQGSRPLESHSMTQSYFIFFTARSSTANRLIYLRACVLTVCFPSLDPRSLGTGVSHVHSPVQNQEQCLAHGRKHFSLTHSQQLQWSWPPRKQSLKVPARETPRKGVSPAWQKPPSATCGCQALHPGRVTVFFPSLPSFLFSTEY